MRLKKGLMLWTALGSVLFTSCQSGLTDLDYILDKNTFILGFTDFPPMGYTDKGVDTGFDIELAQAVMDKIGVTMQTRYIEWDAKVLELNSKRIDAIWNGLTITEERKLEMTFSKPYFENNLVILSKANSGIVTRDDLASKNIGVELSSSGDIALSKEVTLVNTLDEVKKYTSSSDAFLALSAGQIDAMIVDEIYARYEVMQENPGMYQVSDDVIGGEFYGVGFRLGDVKLASAIDDAMDDLVEEGFVSTLSIQYFGENLFYRP